MEWTVYPCDGFRQEKKTDGRVKAWKSFALVKMNAEVK